MFSRFFGKKKKNDGFYLQLDDEGNAPQPAAKAKEKAKPAEIAASAPAVVAPSATSPVTVTTPVAVAPIATPAVASVVTSAGVPAATVAQADVKLDKKAAEKAEKEAAKLAKRAAKKAEEAKKAAEAPAPVVAAPVAVAAPITNFATDYLIKPSSISGRRRPGANMNGFLDMARQAQKPVAFKK